MSALGPAHRAAVETLATTLAETTVAWALTGSTSFALQGVPLDPNDVDVQTTESGAYRIEEMFADEVVDPVTFAEGEGIRSHFGALDVEGVRVEVMGAVEREAADGTWESAVDVAACREFLDMDGTAVPVLPLGYEAQAYEQLGRDDRAALLREYVDEE